MRPIATRAIEVVALAVVLFVGIAGQAFAGATDESKSTGACKVTLGGWVKTTDGDTGTFGIVANGGKGQVEYQDHGPVTDINVHSIDVRSVVCGDGGGDGDGEIGLVASLTTLASSSETQASIFGTATINGSGSFDYQIDVQDFGEPGTADTYRIRLSNGYDSGEQTLLGGNVQIRQLSSSEEARFERPPPATRTGLADRGAHDLDGCGSGSSVRTTPLPARRAPRSRR